VLGELRSELHLSETLTALHGSMFGIGMFGAGLVGNIIVGRFGRARTFWTALCGVTIGIVLFCLGRTVGVTLTGATIGGLSAAVVVMVLPGLIADHHGEHRSEAFAATNAYPPLWGVTLSLLVGGAIGVGISWRLAYGLAMVAIFLTIVTVGRRAEIPAAPPVASRASWRVLRDRTVRRAWFDVSIAIMVEFPTGVWSTVYLKEVGGARPAVAPILGATFAVALFAARVLQPRFSAIFGPRLREVAIVATGLATIAFRFAPGLPGKTLALAAVGFAAGPLYTTSVDRLYIAAPQIDSQTLSAVVSLASGLAVATAPVALGVVADIVGLRDAILIVPIFAVVAIVLSQRNRVSSTRNHQPISAS
jgi:MFS family permease